MVQQIMMVIHVLLALSIIGLVLIQHGKGADAGAAFGSGASQTVFGSQGSGNFLTRLTTLLVFLFACTSISLSIVTVKQSKTSTLSERLDSVTKSASDLNSKQAPKDTDLPSIPVTPKTEDKETKKEK